MAFNIYTILFTCLAFQSLIIGNIFIWYFSKKEKANIYIGIILLMFGITLSEYVLYWTHYQRIFPYLIGISESFPLAFGPVFFCYFRQLFYAQKIKKQDTLHFLPAVLLFAYRIPLYLSPATEKFKQLKVVHFEAEQFFFHELLPWIEVIQMSIYAGIIFYFLRQQSMLTEQRKWANYVLLFFIGYILSFASYYILSRFSFFSPEWDYAISFMMAAFIAFVAIFAYIQPQVFQGYQLQDLPAVFHQIKYTSSQLSPTLIQEIHQNLNNLMKIEKLYLENDLNLEKLAQRVGTNRHILSQFLNEFLGFSFFEYINNQRIELAKELLTNTTKQELNVIEIAYRVGFNNKVSFNQAFKKVTGLSPTEFRAKKELNHADKNGFTQQL